MGNLLLGTGSPRAVRGGIRAPPLGAGRGTWRWGHGGRRPLHRGVTALGKDLQQELLQVSPRLWLWLFQ